MTQTAVHQADSRQHVGRLDDYAIEAFVASLSKSELMALRNLLANQKIQRTPRIHADYEDVELQNFQSLTDRESQVLTLIAKGYTRPDVATALKITRNTAASHVASIYRKLDVSSIAEATMYAYRWGLVR